MQVEKPQYFKNSTILTQLKSTPHPPLGSKNKESQEKALTFKWKTNATNSSPKDKISGIIFVVDSTNKMRLNVARS